MSFLLLLSLPQQALLDNERRRKLENSSLLFNCFINYCLICIAVLPWQQALLDNERRRKLETTQYGHDEMMMVANKKDKKHVQVRYITAHRQYQTAFLYCQKSILTT